MRWISLISSGHYIQMQKNSPSSQVPVEHSSVQKTQGHKSSLSKFKKIEIVSSTFSDHNTMRLDINYEKNTVTNTWRLNNMFVNNEPVTEEIKREIQKFLDTNDNESTTTQNLWDAAVQKRKFMEIRSYLKKQEKQQIYNLNLYLKETEKEEQKQLVEGKKS